MISALAALVLSLAAPSLACHTVHGRMDLWNGAPTVRIWVIGTHRLLGVAQHKESFDDLPDAVRRIWTGRNADADSGRPRSMATSGFARLQRRARDTCRMSA